jgi:hypothetical protein
MKIELRLYHSCFSTNYKALAIIFFFLYLGGCSATKSTQDIIKVTVLTDGKQYPVQVPIGSSVEKVLSNMSLSLGSLDRVEPPPYTIVQNGDQVRIIRVVEKFSVEQEVIPFEQKNLQTESLPDQITLIAQKGENGLKEITYRHLFEDGVEVSNNRVNDGVVIKEAVPEIIMIGIQAPFMSYSIPGRIVYLLGGNAWLMEGTTANRRPVVTSGDLDGRIFSLSSDGSWLLFTRKSSKINEINTLWAVNIGIDAKSDKLINLKVSNIVHYADWMPGSSRNDMAFSTVEARTTAPGWQANNDLNVLSVSSSSWVSKWKTYLGANSGGVYGWWGMNFSWNPTGSHLAYARPDEVGLLDLESGNLTPLLKLVPLQTHEDWAWVPGMTWAPSGNTIYTIDHMSPPGGVSPEESQVFDLTAIPLIQGAPIHFIHQVGMFAYPITSPLINLPEAEGTYRVAFLQAIFSNQSETSRYRLSVVDQDGSNVKTLFPAEGEPGLEPQRVVWSPAPMPDSNTFAIAVLYNGNLWIIDNELDANGKAIIRQITGDELVSRLAWAGK